MFRYMALIWNSRNSQQTDVVGLVSRHIQTPLSQWNKVVDNGGLRVFCIDSVGKSLAPLPLSNHRGVVLGTLFNRNADPEDETPSQEAALTDRETTHIVESRGRRLITNYWGNYVAIIRESAGAYLAIKDPTGTLPCFVTTYRGVTIVFSCISDCAKLEFLHFTIDWSFVANRVLGKPATAGGSGLNEISEIHRGECMEINSAFDAQQVSRRMYWDPLSFYESDELVMDDHDCAARAVRGTIISCIHSLASRHESLLLRLSGGLDSSIVLGCLKDAPAEPQIGRAHV